MAGLAHAAHELMTLRDLLVFIARELRDAVGVQDHRLLARSLPLCHQLAIEHELAILEVCHRRADDALAEEVEDDTQIQLALAVRV